MRLKALSYLLAATIFCGLSLHAQSWDTLRTLQPGNRIKVLDRAGEVRSGAFAKVSADAISFITRKGEVSIEKARVSRVQVRSSGRRMRNLLIGAGIGVAIGVAVDQGLGAYLRNESGESDAVRAVSYIAPIGIFAAIGAALPGYKTIYRAP